MHFDQHEWERPRETRPLWFYNEQGFRERLTDRWDSPKQWDRAAQALGGVIGISVLAIVIALFLTVGGIQATKKPLPPVPVAEARW